MQKERRLHSKDPVLKSVAWFKTIFSKKITEDSSSNYMYVHKPIGRPLYNLRFNTTNQTDPIDAIES